MLHMYFENDRLYNITLCLVIHFPDSYLKILKIRFEY